MFERFTDGARRALVTAQMEARSLGDEQLRPPHILLGLLHIGDGVAYHVLTEAGISYASARGQIEVRATSTPGESLPLDGEALSSLGIDLAAIRDAIDA